MKKLFLKTALVIMVASSLMIPGILFTSCCPITDVQVLNITETSAVIRWNTELSCNSFVQYGLSADKLIFQSEIDNTLVRSHRVELTNLAPDTRYFYRPCSTCTGEGCNGLPAAVQSFVTPSAYYVLVTLESVTPLVHTDGAAGGMDVVVACVASTQDGNITQATNFPGSKWYEADVGQIIAVNMPIFCLPEGEMGDDLAITIDVIDDDNKIDWLKVAWTNFPWQPVTQMLSLKLGGNNTSGNWTTYFEDMGNRISDWMAKEKDDLGHYAYFYAEDEEWGIRSEPYCFTAGKVNLCYSIQRVRISGRPIEVRLKPIQIHNDGDECPDECLSGAGDLYLMARMSTRFGHRLAQGQMEEIPFRYPSSGTTDKDSGTTWGYTWDPPWKTIFSTSLAAPYIFVEVAIWDDDDGTFDDCLGIFAESYAGANLPPQGPFTQTYSKRLTMPNGGSATVEWEVIGH